jgi:cysteinyl-tRNA synthetase
VTLRLYNTLTRRKEEFVPLDPTNVRMYVCGPTVYDYAHIGNARPVIVFDVLFRLLRHLYGAEHVTYVRNITDIDDKINARAAERRGNRNVPVLEVLRELTEETQAQYLADVTALGNLSPTVTPRATEHVREMIAMIDTLVAGGHAYAADGHVLFDVASKADYGKLSRRPLDEMIAGARVEVAPYKKNPMDFVLWKPSDADTPGWESRWGRGRPGWHIECSAMAGRYLGETFDIHGGGIDLLFPHHENEIAQSECAHHGHPLASVWMHNGFLQVEGEKMSKSLGNFVTIRELLKDWPGDVLRFNMLRTHYRQPMDWTVQGMTESRATLRSWKEAMSGAGMAWQEHNREYYGTLVPSKDFVDFLSDDLNSHQAIAALHRLISGGSLDGAHTLYASLSLIGLTSFDEMQQWEREEDQRLVTPPDVQRAIDARNAARAAKNFAEADRIRDELLEQGVQLKDSPSGTTWEVKR